jgi:NAD(P)-dependent dehydrogenase (short-subunit alcohol dehydrogenase family)
MRGLALLHRFAAIVSANEERRDVQGRGGMAEAQGAEDRASGRFDGQAAIVTGAGSRGEGIGNGRATAILLARRGAFVTLVDAMPDWAEATRRMIEAEGGRCQVVEADVTKSGDCEAAVDATVEAAGRLDILVNNVGIGGPPGDAVEVDMTEWDAAMAVNLTSMVLMAKHAIPVMRRQGAGAIVNIASVAGIRGGHPHLFYPVSKGAILNLTRQMAAMHGTEGIRVNCIAPGMVYTPMVYTRGMSEELREARRKRSLLQIEGEGWDVGNAVCFLASEEARWITGVVLPVDAGATAGEVASPVPTMV